MSITRREKFTEVYQKNVWKGTESLSGTGSDLTQTAAVREALPALMKELRAKSIVDAPCGDLHWMKDVPWEQLGVSYTGVDIVAELVERLRTRFPQRQFECLDLVTDLLPRADVIFCRDCLVHLPSEEVQKVIRNFASSDASWLLTTTFPEHNDNRDVRWSGWRPLNLQLPPFSLPAPDRLISERCTENNGAYADKSLALWPIAALRNV